MKYQPQKLKNTFYKITAGRLTASGLKLFIMKKSVEISGNRLAFIEASLQYNRTNIERVAHEIDVKVKEFPKAEEEGTFPSLYDNCLLNELEDCTKPRVDSVSILSGKYKKEATFLTESDLVKIQDTIQELFIELRQEPYSLSEYYS